MSLIVRNTNTSPNPGIQTSSGLILIQLAMSASGPKQALYSIRATIGLIVGDSHQ